MLAFTSQSGVANSTTSTPGSWAACSGLRFALRSPGRKTDIKDAQWLYLLLEAGLLRGVLVPSKPIRTLRGLTRYRKAQINDRRCARPRGR